MCLGLYAKHFSSPHRVHGVELLKVHNTDLVGADSNKTQGYRLQVAFESFAGSYMCCHHPGALNVSSTQLAAWAYMAHRKLGCFLFKCWCRHQQWRCGEAAFWGEQPCSRATCTVSPSTQSRDLLRLACNELHLCVNLCQYFMAQYSDILVPVQMKRWPVA